MTRPRWSGRLLAGLFAALVGCGGLAATAPGALAAGEAGSLTVSASPPVVAYGGRATLTGVLTDPAGAPVVGAPVLAEAQRADGSWTPVSPASLTDASGAVAVSVSPEVSSVERLRQDGAGGAVSPPVTVPVRAALTAALGRTSAAVGWTVPVSGSVAPAPSGAVVRVERWVGGRWTPVAQVPVAADGSWSARVPSGAAGFAVLRAVRPAASGVLGSTVPLAAVDVYRLHTYSVTTRGRVTADLATFRAVLAATYADPRGWRRAHHRFRYVGGRGGDLTVVLAQARTLPTFSRECSAAYSCRAGRFVVVNQDRWKHGSPYFPGDLATYRQMVVDHETGHWLGRPHAYCSGPGALAPVMQQQSKGMHGCRPNAWPLPFEIRAVS